MISQASNYDYAVDPSVDSAAAFVIRFTGHNKKVLDVGAGPGSISRVLKDHYGCRITALEIHPDSVQRLKTFCDNVIEGDLNNPHWPQLLPPTEKFDVIISADVLEHIYDPLTTLKKMTQLIHQDGEIIISLPHAGHAVIMGCLWQGNFEYKDFGLLDRTHIRFFCLKNIQELVEEAGLCITDAKFYTRMPVQTEFASQWFLLPDNVKETLLASPFSCVYQVVIKAVPLKKGKQTLNLTQVTIPPSVFGWLDRIVPDYGWRRNIRRLIRLCFSKEQKARLRSLAKKFGIRI